MAPNSAPVKIMVTSPDAIAPGHRGLFLGLATLDMIYRAATPLGVNEKQVAQDYQLSPGGPATNAAVAFAQLNHHNDACLAAVLGQHPLTQLVRADLELWNVSFWDLRPDYDESPSVSSILVHSETGERAIISINAERYQWETQGEDSEGLKIVNRWKSRIEGLDILLIDGHQMALSALLAPLAQAQGIPVVVDGGSWKPGFETVLAATDYAICSAAFRPPGCFNEAETLAYLQGLGLPHIAFTHGHQPITYWRQDSVRSGQTSQSLGQTAAKAHQSPEPQGLLASQPPGYSHGQVAVPKIQAVDTLGAGDIFHGAFCHYILERGFPQALEAAGAIASLACTSFGTRSWLSQL